MNTAIAAFPPSLAAADRLHAAASKAIGLLHLLTEIAASTTEYQGPTNHASEGVRRLASETQSELADAIEEVFQPAPEIQP